MMEVHILIGFKEKEMRGMQVVGMILGLILGLFQDLAAPDLVALDLAVLAKEGNGADLM